MQGEPDRDRAIDRALRQSLRAPMTSPHGDCIDGETLAAWTEGQLRTDAAAVVEAHLSGCTRCQQLLATFARTAPPSIAAEPLWRRWRLQWLVPIATAATVAALWVGARPQDVARVNAVADKADAVASREPVPPPPASPIAPPPPPARLQKEAASPQSRAASSLATRELDRIDAAKSASARQEAAAAQERPQLGQTVPDAQLRDRVAGIAETITVAPPTRPAPTAPPSPAAPPPAQAAAEAAAVPPQQAVVDAQSRAADAAALPSVRTARAAGSLLATRPLREQFEIVSPTAGTRWRVVTVAPRRVERSIDGGQRWEPVSMPTDVVLTFGASTSPTICWIVGQAGTVFLTTDGTRFRRLPFPERIDLVSVSASDDRHATVMSGDGRTFRTDDQGKSWTR